MAKEIKEIPEVIAKQGESNAPMLIKLAEFLRKTPPTGITLLGRGSSKNACYYAKYIFETALNIPVSMASPSIASVYDRTLKFDNQLMCRFYKIKLLRLMEQKFQFCFLSLNRYLRIIVPQFLLSYLEYLN